MGAEARTEINLRNDPVRADPRACPADAAMAKSPRATTGGCPDINPVEFVVTRKVVDIFTTLL